jgi:YHS domain-containing protein
MKRSWIVVAVVAIVASFGVAAYSSGSSSAAPINDKCPVSGEKIDAKQTSELKIGFCCGNCKGKFEKDPVSALNKMDKVPNETCPLAGKPVKDASSTVSIAFCCDDCKAKFDKEPGKYLAKLKAAEKK